MTCKVRMTGGLLPHQLHQCDDGIERGTMKDQHNRSRNMQLHQHLKTSHVPIGKV